MDENGNLKLIYTWPVIILFWIVFWPIGLGLTCRRGSFEKTDLRGAMLLDIIGWFWYISGIFMTILLATGAGITESDAVVLVFYFVIGGIHQLFAKRKRKKVFEKSSSKVTSRNIVDCEYTVKREKEVKIQKELEMPKGNKREEKVVICECCGARNVVYGTVGKCEYCRMPIN